MNAFRWLFLIAFCALLRLASPALADPFVGADEMSAKARWVKGTLLSMEKPVVSFRYHGKASANLMPSWDKAPLSTEALSDGRTRYRLEWTDTATGLDVRVEAVEYGDYPAVEWTAYLKNVGSKATPIIDGLRAIDSTFAMGSPEAVLRTTQGDNFSPNSYEPFAFSLNEDGRSFHPEGGGPPMGRGRTSMSILVAPVSWSPWAGPGNGRRNSRPKMPR